MGIAPVATPLPLVQPVQIPERKESGADQDNDGDNAAAASKPAATMPSIPAGMGTSVNTAA
jgi:hypothetical protein